MTVFRRRRPSPSPVVEAEEPVTEPDFILLRRLIRDEARRASYREKASYSLAMFDGWPPTVDQLTGLLSKLNRAEVTGRFF